MSKKSLYIISSMVVIFALLWIMPSFDSAEAAVPDNDEFENARLITSLPFTDTVDVTDATMNPLDPVYCGEPLNSVWYRFTPGQNMNVLFDVNESNYKSHLCIYTGDYATGLTYYHGTYKPYEENFPLYEGVPYFIQVFLEPISYPEPEDKREKLVLKLSHLPGPDNDFFTDATLIDQLPFTTTIDFVGSAGEDQEPSLDPLFHCQHTVWYKYPALSEGVVYGFVASEFDIDALIMTGEKLGDMVWRSLKEGVQKNFEFAVEPGVIYYLQFCTNYNDLNQVPLYLSSSASIEPNFETNPADPNSLETVQFCDRSVDPAGSQMIHFWWDFGDGNIQETSDPCISYRFPVDGEYFIWHKVLTDTGLYAEMSRELVVQSHDVSISILNAPFLGKIGKTVKVSVGVQSHITDEYVKVSLSILGRSGSKEIDYFVEKITPDQGVVEIPFEYTFTSEDARDGLVIFKAVAETYSRDFNLRNNQAYSFPVFIIRHPPIHPWNPYPAPIK